METVEEEFFEETAYEKDVAMLLAPALIYVFTPRLTRYLSGLGGASFYRSESHPSHICLNSFSHQVDCQ